MLLKDIAVQTTATAKFLLEYGSGQWRNCQGRRSLRRPCHLLYYQRCYHYLPSSGVIFGLTRATADQTSYINYIKPLLLAEELNIQHVISVIDTKDEWYYQVHPERYVPALKDCDPETNRELIVFESTACLQYLADRFDTDGTWSGKNAWEKAQVMSWSAYQTAGLGYEYTAITVASSWTRVLADHASLHSPTAKYWLYFSKGYPNRQNPEVLPKTVAKYVKFRSKTIYLVHLTEIDRLHANVLVQWDKLEKRLSSPEQRFIALPDRPTIADISYFPFAMPWMFRFLQVDIKDWPHIEKWGNRMLSRPAVQKILERGPTYGHGLDE